MDVLVPPLTEIEIRAALFGRPGERPGPLALPKGWEDDNGLELWPVERAHKTQAEWAGKLRTIRVASPFDGIGEVKRRWAPVSA